MATPIFFLEPYSCPRCRASLEASSGGTGLWHRCPRCGRASLPPESPQVSSRAHQSEGEILFIGPADGSRSIPAFPLSPPARGVSVGRILFFTGLLISSLMLVYSIFEHDSIKAAVTGLATLIFFGLLAIPPRRR